MRTKQNFSRRNQPVACRMCGKLTTWSDVNGFVGLALCKPCFDAATLENGHFDGAHEVYPQRDCPHCIEKQKQQARAATLAGDYERQGAALRVLEQIWGDHAAAQAFYTELEGLRRG